MNIKPITQYETIVYYLLRDIELSYHELKGYTGSKDVTGIVYNLIYRHGIDVIIHSSIAGKYYELKNYNKALKWYEKRVLKRHRMAQTKEEIFKMFLEFPSLSRKDLSIMFGVTESIVYHTISQSFTNNRLV